MLNGSTTISSRCRSRCQSVGAVADPKEEGQVYFFFAGRELGSIGMLGTVCPDGISALK